MASPLSTRPSSFGSSPEASNRIAGHVNNQNFVYASHATAPLITIQQPLEQTFTLEQAASKPNMTPTKREILPSYSGNANMGVSPIMTSRFDSSSQDDAFVQPIAGSDYVKVKMESAACDRLRSVLSEVSEASVVWDAVREKILSQYKIWELLLDKAAFAYFYETKSKKLPKDNVRKFKAVVSEMEEMLGEFKCFMDGCCTEAVNSEDEPYLVLNPELSRAYGESPSKQWKVKDQTTINSFHLPFFASHDFFNHVDMAIVEEPDQMEEEEENSSLGDAFDDPDYIINDEFPCSKCGKSYTRELNLEKHLVKCRGRVQPSERCKWVRKKDGLIACDVDECFSDARFYDLKELWTHFQENHAIPEDFVYRCPKCDDFSAVYPDLLKAHEKLEHSEGQDQKSGNHACKECNVSFKIFASLSRHMKKIHPDSVNTEESAETLYNCDLCDFSSAALNGLSLHKRRLHKVDKNNKAVTLADNPDFHERDPKRFKHVCSKCTRRYKKPHHLERHLAKCDGIPPPTLKPMWQKNEDGRFSCALPGCNSDKTWTSSFSVWHHFNAEHADMQDDSYCVFKCDLCELKFPNRSMLTRHRNHKHESLFRFECTKCHKRLASNKLLKLHMIQHTGEKPFSCEFCDYKAITQSFVNQHKMRMHEGSIPDKVLPRHVCDICGKSFKVRSNLKEHIASHSDARSFLCGICGKSLKNRQCLNRHLFTHGVKHTCHICNKNFANPSTLNIHQRDKHGLRG